MIDEDLEGLGSDELKELKLKEEVTKLRLQNRITSRSMVDRREVLDELLPLIIGAVESLTTLADDMSGELANSDAKIIHDALSSWVEEKLDATVAAINGKIAEVRDQD